MTASAKDILIKPIASRDANALVRRLHYSGKVASNSQLHLGVFLDGRLEGAMQFGPSLDKRKTLGLVRDTKWNGFLELNRLAFGPALPRNSESRALSIALRMIRKHYPHVEWIISFADGTQCGDGTIYRAAGFVLTGIKKNTTIWAAPDDGETYTETAVINRMVATDTRRPERGRLLGIINRVLSTKGANIVNRMSLTEAKSQAQAQALKSIGKPMGGGATMKPFRDAGFAPLHGFQLRYVYFLNPDARARLTVPELPYSKIAEMGAGMYLGKARGKEQAPAHHAGLDGATPIPTLQPSDVVETKKPGRKARAASSADG